MRREVGPPVRRVPRTRGESEHERRRGQLLVVSLVLFAVSVGLAVWLFGGGS